jgi:N12 class adenine-specific DNA methylase
MKTRAAIAALALGLAFVVNACGGGGSSADVKASLKEFSVTLDPREHKAGSISIDADNTGSIQHEFVVVKAKDAAALPLNADGSVDEDKIAKADQLGEMEDIAAGKSKSHTFKLPAGDYVMFCNVVNEKKDAPPVVHFKEGMHETFTAT